MYICFAKKSLKFKSLTGITRSRFSGYDLSLNISAPRYNNLIALQMYIIHLVFQIVQIDVRTC